MPATAAIFDLDRTLIRSSSAPVFQNQLVEAGFADTPSIPLADAYLKFYETFGESWVLMQPAKLTVRAAKDWSVELTDAAVANAAIELEEMLLPYARKVFDQHRTNGDLLVMATTSPLRFVQPFADLLGFDAVIATRWQHADGVYTGKLDSPFYWGRAKLDGVREWADENDVDLAQSHAYSDSYFDTPLLAAVGNPVAVNPDPRLRAVAALHGWSVRHLDKPAGVAKVLGREAQDWLRPFLRPELFAAADISIAGAENIPSTGPALVVFNHRSYFDLALMALVSARAGRSVRGLGKREMFDVPVVGGLLKALGGISVDRGSGSRVPLESAIAALNGGEVLMLAPEGTIPRGPAFFEPSLQLHTGAARMAAATKAPVIPVGIWGTEHVWPRNARMPNLTSRRRPTVTATVGPPIDLKYRSHKRDTERIADALMAMLPPEAHVAHTPTEEELASTYPTGKAPKRDDA